ncbi:MAG: lipocalin family protein [Ktedonobacterales bacterium]
MRTTRKLSHAWYAAGVLLLALLVAACGMPGTISSGGRLPRVSSTPPTQAPLPPVRFPQDEAPHHDLTEWWYYTGHLHGTDAQGHARTYGFELTFFQTLRGGFSPYYAAHYAVSDITGGGFHYDQRAAFEPASVIPPEGSANGFAVTLGDWSARGLNGHDQLAAASADYAIALNLTGTRPPALHGGTGIISYGPAGFSYYYSRTRMSVAGTLTDHNTPVTVTGQAWMDHQWGNFVSLTGSGWDWFSIQLDDKTDYMLYVIRDAQKQPISVFGTAVAADGTASEIPSTAIKTQALSTWTSPHTNGVYPSGWQVTLPSQRLTLTLKPLLLDQELVTAQSTGVAYWEGAVGVTGQRGSARVTGEGYVELTGYAAIPSSSQSAAVP